MFHKLYKYKFLINVDYRYYIIKDISILHLEVIVFGQWQRWVYNQLTKGSFETAWWAQDKRDLRACLLTKRPSIQTGHVYISLQLSAVLSMVAVFNQLKTLQSQIRYPQPALFPVLSSCWPLQVVVLDAFVPFSHLAGLESKSSLVTAYSTQSMPFWTLRAQLTCF